MRHTSIPATTFPEKIKRVAISTPRLWIVSGNPLNPPLTWANLFVSSNHVRLKNGHDWTNSINCAKSRFNEGETVETLAGLDLEGSDGQIA